MIYFYPIVFLCFILSPSILMAQEESRADKDPKICTLLKSALANSASLRSGDFLVRKKVTFDSTGIRKSGEVIGTLLESTRFSRIVFDHENGRFAHYDCVENARKMAPDFDKTSSAKFTGFCCNGKNGEVAKFRELGKPTVRNRSDLGTQAEFLYAERFPDFRGFWAYRGPSRYGALEKEDTLKAMIAGEYFHSSRRRGNKLDIYFDGGSKPPTGEEFLKIYTFDMENLVVTGIRAVLVKGRKQEEIASFKIVWKEINNIMVPISGRLERTGFSIVDVNKKELGKHYEDYAFHWFLVNKEIDERLVSIDNIKNRATILTFVDPVKVKANTLIENDSSKE